MSIHQFHQQMHTASTEARSFRQLRTLGVDALKKVGKNWNPWA